MDTHDRLPMGEVTRRSGFAASAVRYYETQGLIGAERTSSGQRTFERSVLRRLAFIRAAANIGLSLEEIRDELDRLPQGRTPTRADWQRISKHWRARLNEQIAAIEALRDGLDSCIGCGCLSLQRCRISNPDDIAAESDQAPGAVRLPARLRAAPGASTRPGGRNRAG